MPSLYSEAQVIPRQCRRKQLSHSPDNIDEILQKNTLGIITPPFAGKKIKRPFRRE